MPGVRNKLRPNLLRVMAALAAGVPGAGYGQAYPAAGMVTPQPDPGPAVASYVVDPAAPGMSRDELIRALREKIKYVFVVFNENHSFDNEFGSFPGANGLYSDGRAPRDAAHTPGFVQSYAGADGKQVAVQPFRIGPAQNATFVDSVDHSHTGLAKKIDVQNGTAAMDGFAGDEYSRFASKGGDANVAMGTQYRPAGDELYRLRHHPVLLAIRQPLRAVRQHLRHRGHALDARTPSP